VSDGVPTAGAAPCRLAAVAADQRRLARADAPSAQLVTFCRAPDDCACAGADACSLVVEALSARAPTPGDPVVAVADLLRLAFGPGRVVFVEVRSPCCPGWLATACCC